MIEANEVKQALCNDIQRVVEMLLPNGKQRGNEWICGDTAGNEGKSLAVSLEGDKAGVWLDFATNESGDILSLWQATQGCDFATALNDAASFIGMLDAKKPTPSPKSSPQVKQAPPNGIDDVTRFTYTDADKNPLIYVIRKNLSNGSKEFRQWGKSEDAQGWIPSLAYTPKPRPLYRVASITDETVICLHEGEKAVVAASMALPFVHTCTIGGANNPKQTDFSPLKGKDVVILPDNDAAGESYLEHCQALAEQAGAKTVAVLRLPSLPTKGDVVEWLENGGTAEQFKKLVTTALKTQAKQTSISPIDEKVLSLSKLSTLEYDQIRKEEAKYLGLRTSTLDAAVDAERKKAASKNSPSLFKESEPWDEPVNGSQLVKSMAAMFRGYVVLPAHADLVAALWVLNTYAHDASFYSPMICIESPEKRCGKSTMMAVFSAVCAKVISVSGISAASLFRAIELWHPTLLIDEVDTFLDQDLSLIGVFNSGHNKHNARIIRCDGDANEPRAFSTWSPKVLSGIGERNGTIKDRSIIIPLKRKTTGEKVKRLRLDRGDFNETTRKCQRWADDNFKAIKAADPTIPEGMNDREADNWTPLLAIADLCNLGEEARAAARALSKIDEDAESIDEMLLSDIKEMFDKTKKDKMASSEICARLNDMEGRPWAEWTKGKPITTNRLAGRLKKFLITSSTIRIGGSTIKGYRLESFNDTFKRYIPHRGSSKRNNVTTVATTEENAILKRNNKKECYVSKPQDMGLSKGCDVVTFQNRVAAQEDKKRTVKI